jgi:thioredoxin reductase
MSDVISVIGAGPYGLSTAAFLRGAGVEVRQFGEVMGFWKEMPRGMFLRSYFRASNIADPDDAFTLTAFEESVRRTLPRPIPLADFIEYGTWFQQQAGLAVDPRRVTNVAQDGAGFRVSLDDGETFEAERVIVAVGITPFPWMPPLYEELGPELASHTSEHRDYDAFRGKAVAVVGAGQSALESAAFLNEAGATTELLVRRAELRFLRGERLYETGSRVSNILYPAWGVGPPGVNWLMGQPAVFRLLPRAVSRPLAARAIRPAGAAWLRPRLEGVQVTAGRNVRSVGREGSTVRLELDDGSTRVVDHVVVGTGYRIDVRRYSFLDADLREKIKLRNGYPKLSAAYESSIPGLHFAGASAAASAGPGMRFVSHTEFTARSIAQGVTRRR